MELNQAVEQLSKAIPNWGADTLQGFDVSNVADGQRIRGSNRQLVRFYTSKEMKIVATEVSTNPKTGEVRVLKTAAVPVEREKVLIITPGDKNTFDDYAEDYHRREYWHQYKAFRDGRTTPLGTPLDECTFLNSGQVTELAYLGCHTLEQLADASDLLCDRIPGGWEAREFARTAVKVQLENKSSGKINLLSNELNTAKDTIRRQEELLARQAKEMAEIKTMVMAQHERSMSGALKESAKKGRKKKAVKEAAVMQLPQEM